MTTHTEDTKPTAQGREAMIVAAAGVHAGDTVLDAGTGTGTLLPALADAVGIFGSIDAMDINATLLAEAHQKHHKLPVAIRFMLSDIESDPVHQLYDRILLVDVFPSLKQPLETLTRLYINNLNGGGMLTIATMASRSMINALAAERGTGLQLPPAAVMAERLSDMGVKVDYTRDDDECWILRIRRR